MAREDLKFNDYKYGFENEDVSVFKTEKGLTEETVREISRLKNEPEWMLEFRLKAYNTFKKYPMPKFGPDLSELDFDSYTYLLVQVIKNKETGMMYLIQSKILSKN